MIARAGIFMLRKSELQFYCKPSQASQPASLPACQPACAWRLVKPSKPQRLCVSCRHASSALLIDALWSADQDGASHIYPDR